MANRILTQPPSAAPADARVRAAAPVMAWLTVERAVYLLLFIVGLGLRLAQLGYRPLSPAEAGDAWAALQTLRGAPTPLPAASPLLFSLHLWSFDIVGAMNTVARFWPALLGALLPVWVYVLRFRLGQPGALVSAVVLTFSTYTLYFARQATGDILAASLTLALLAALVRWHDDGDSRWLMAGAVAGGLLLASAPSAWFGLLGMAALLLLAGRDVWRKVADAVRGEAAGRVAIVGVVTYVVGSTGFFRSWTRLGDGASALGRWLGGFFGGDAGYPILWLPVRLLTDEPLLAVFAVIAVVLVIRQALRAERWTLRAGLAVWGVGALVLVTLRAGRQPGDLLMVIVPLALLAGPLLVELVAAVDWRGSWPEALIFLVGGTVILVVAAILLTSYTFTRSTEWLQLVIAPLGIIAAFILFYGYWVNGRFALRLAAVLGLIAVAALNLSNAWTSSVDLDPARRPAIVHTVADPSLNTLVDEVTQISAMRVGDPTSVPMAIVGEAANPTLAWAFRQFRNASLLSSVAADTAPVVVISTVASPPALGDVYSGSVFTALRTFDPLDLAGRERLRWLQYRRAAPDSETRAQVILWLRHEDR